jgi:hypothetical protein
MPAPMFLPNICIRPLVGDGPRPHNYDQYRVMRVYI